MAEKELFYSEQKLSRTEIAEQLRKIAEGLDNGEVNLKSGSNSINVKPSERPELEVKVEEESDGEISLEVEIEWKEGEESSGLEIG